MRHKPTPPKTPEAPVYITKAGLKGKRGWTDKLCTLFLGEPDKLATNPHYKSGPEVKLYLLEKIEAIEKTQSFDIQKQQAAGRKKKAAGAVATKRANIMQYVSSMKILVPVFNKQFLFKKACDSYNRHKQSRLRDDEIFEPATVDSDERFLHRITLNYLRHKCTRYESELKKIFGKTGNDAAYEILKQRVNEAIVKQYDFLAE